MEHLNSKAGITETGKRLLLKIARESLHYYMKTGKYLEYDSDVLPDALVEKCGVFVCLYKGQALRGCSGSVWENSSVFSQVQKMTVSAAVYNNKFSSLKYGELEQILIEISVLGQARKIADISEIERGKHGIHISRGADSGTFLPQVALKSDWTIEEFLGHCARDQAGIGWDGWKGSDIFIFTAEVFHE